MIERMLDSIADAWFIVRYRTSPKFRAGVDGLIRDMGIDSTVD